MSTAAYVDTDEDLTDALGANEMINSSIVIDLKKMVL